jgi:DNA-binding NarL/FixJ family response regulator
MNLIILADNQATFRAGIAKVLTGEAEFRVAAQFSYPTRMISAVDIYRPLDCGLRVCPQAEFNRLDDPGQGRR